MDVAAGQTKRGMMFNLLKVLGTVGKGLATIVGVGGVTIGAGTLSAVPPDLNESLRLLIELFTVLSALLATFGIGRKAGATL